MLVFLVFGSDDSVVALLVEGRYLADMVVDVFGFVPGGGVGV